ncbi:MAG: chitinase [Clostridiales bacterium]|nr:chitinase [Clostridiales bacterium]
MLILGYVGDRGLPFVTEGDAKMLDGINIAFGKVADDFTLGTWELRHNECHEQIRKWNPNIKIVVSVGGWTAGGFSLMSRTEAGRKKFARSCAKYVAENGIDGIDIDWEYPCSDSAGIDCDPSDKQNFTLLLQTLRDELGKDKIVSIAAGAGAYFVRDTEMDKVAEICDYVQIMTYDMRSGFCRQAGHHTAPFATKGDDSGLDTMSMVKLFNKGGVPLDKIVIGAAFYSRKWGGVPDVDHGLLQPAGTIGDYGAGYAALKKDYINKNGFTRYWDEDAQAPFLFNGSTLISYDDPDSLKAKCGIVKNNGLLGIMYWEHGCDDTRELLTTIYENR